MITFYTIVKGFEGEFDRIQRNAIGSWLRVPGAEVLLFGEGEPGAVEYAREMGLPIYAVERDRLGIPFVSSALEQGERLATHPVRCYLNADIVVLPAGFRIALRIVKERFDKFLLSARRWDLDHETLLDFEGEWEQELECQARERGSLHRKPAIDVFCHNGVEWGEVPPFAIGRFAWDNDLLERALQDGAAFVDATPVCTVIHQNHSITWKPEDRRDNLELFKRVHGLDSDEAMHDAKRGFADAQWKITEEGELKKLRG